MQSSFSFVIRFIISLVELSPFSERMEIINSSVDSFDAVNLISSFGNNSVRFYIKAENSDLFTNHGI